MRKGAATPESTLAAVLMGITPDRCVSRGWHEHTVQHKPEWWWQLLQGIKMHCKCLKLPEGTRR